MILSKRLQAIVSLVPRGSRVADVGTDHGYVPVYLVKENIAASAIAMDVRSGPLSRAAEHIARYGVEDRVELRLSDGLRELSPGEADTIIIAGLGGPLMTEILSQGGPVAQAAKNLILSPQSDIPGVRVFLRENGYRIDRELFLRDEGKYYTVMAVSRGQGRPGRYIDDLYGGYLLDHGNTVLREFLERERERYQELLPGLEASTKEETKKRAESMRRELENVELALQILSEGEKNGV